MSCFVGYLLLQKREKLHDIRETEPLSGLRVFQGSAPHHWQRGTFSPQAQQI